MQRDCAACGAAYEARSPKSKFCQGVECRRARERARNAVRRGANPAAVVALPPPEVDPDEGPNERVTRVALSEVGRLETVQGQNAMTLARRLDRAAGDTGSSFAALAKQHLASVDLAVAGAAVEADPIDQLRTRRELKLVGNG